MAKRSAKSLSLEQQIASGTLQTNTAIVLDFIKSNKVTHVHEMRKYLKFMSHQTLTSRISDLEDEGWIYSPDNTQVLCDDGKTRTYSLYCYESDPKMRATRAHARKYNKYQRLKYRILDEFYEFYKSDTTWKKP